jgi:hypothetical protein
MLRFLVVAVAVLIGTPASTEDIGSTGSTEGSFQSEDPEPSSRPIEEVGGSEAVLMGILAAAVFGFQLRRKFKASARNWQRIALPTEAELPVAPIIEESPQPESDSTEAPALRMRWQQTH